jgi:hypothetical protein
MTSSTATTLIPSTTTTTTTATTLRLKNWAEEKKKAYWSDWSSDHWETGCSTPGDKYWMDGDRGSERQMTLRQK